MTADGAGWLGRLGWRRGWAGVLLAAAAYLLLVCLLCWPVAPWSNTMVLNQAKVDPPQMIWFLEWVPWAAVHGLNPLFTNYLDAPHGVNLTANASSPLLGVLGSPVTLTVGPVSTFNLLLRLGWAGSGFTMFLALRRWTAWWPAAFLGGALFLLSPYLLRQSATHLNLVFMVVPPLILIALDQLFVRETSSGGRRGAPRRIVALGVALGLLATAQWLIDPEMLVDCLLMTVIGFAVLALARPHQVRARVAAALPGLAVGGVVLVVLLAYPVWAFLAGPQHLVGPVNAAWITAGYRSDLLGPVVRNIAETTTPPAWAVTQHRPSAKVLRWEGNDAYLGVPMLVVLVVVAVAGWRNGLVRFFSLMAVIAFVLSLGPALTIDGHTFGIPMPGGVFAHVSVLDNLLPQRLTAFYWIFGAVVLAVGLDEVHRRLVRRSRSRPARARAVAASAVSVVLVGLVGAAFVPMVAGATHRRAVPVPQRLAARVIVRHTPPGGVVLFLPAVTDLTPRPMLWQADSAMAYRMVGGYAIIPGTSYASQILARPTDALARLWATAPYVQSPSAPPPGPTQAYAACQAIPSVIQHYRVDTIVVWPTHIDHHAIEHALAARLGPPQVDTEKLLVWDDVKRRVRDEAACSSLSPVATASSGESSRSSPLGQAPSPEAPASRAPSA